MSDEFSAHPLDRSWIWENPGKNSTYMMNRGRFVLTLAEDKDSSALIDRTPRILRDPMEGDWIIDTHHTETTAEADSTAHTGIVLFGDSNNWLVWGVLANSSLEASGLLAAEGNSSEIIKLAAVAEKYDFIRIRKRTNESQYPRYYFYYGSSRISWMGAGYWEDTLGVFNNAKVGLLGKPSGKAYTVEYDYFTEYVPTSEIDEFSDNILDPVWSWSAGKSSYSFTGGYMANSDLLLNVAMNDNLTPESSLAAMILKHPINAISHDWIIDTHVKQRAPIGLNSHGLILFKDKNNWLQWVQAGNGTMVLSGCVKGALSGAIGSVPGLHDRLRARKNGNEYHFDYSSDGIDWVFFMSYWDVEDSLTGMKYGIIAEEWGTADYTVAYAFFRERYKPAGTLRDIAGLTETGMLTGPGSMNDSTQNDVYGTDLGSITEMDGKHYFMFGDTYSKGEASGVFEPANPNWRANVLGVTEQTDPSQGISLSMIADNQGKAVELIESPKGLDFNDWTAIPTYGISYNHTLYHSYMNIYHWGQAAHWDCGYSEWAYSKDLGRSWTKTGIRFGSNSNFIQLCCVKDRSTVYIFGIPSSRFGGVKLFKVPEDQILETGAYRYYAGKDSEGFPVWSGNEANAVLVAPGPVGEFSVIYNAFLGKWIMTYLSEHTLDIEIREADHPWGEWSQIPLPLVDHTISGYDVFLYAPFMAPAYVENEGETIYFTLSRWMPFYNVAWMKAKLVK